MTTSSTDARAAVLAPVYRDVAGALHIVLIVRTDRGHHGGQLAFPGGRVDDEDESLVATALREAEEEIGLDPSCVSVIAELSPVRSGPTNMEVFAFLGRIPDGVEWRPNREEVVEVLTPTVAELWDPAIRREHLFTSALWPEGLLVDGIPVGDRVLWGMTLRLLDDLVPRLLAGEWEDALR
ncbi:MAG TPA: CoA pyrophosphatase [Gaiellaceae bacterium]|nr:CoA pyrophosphatase [Gaiellaceae bacterium]